MVLKIQPVKPRKRPLRNYCERNFEELAESKGWEFSKRGWPDFLCWDEDGPFAVEVKRRIKNGNSFELKRDQIKTLNALSDLGLRCFVSDGRRLEPYRRR
jgi:hypothetical protein